MWTPADAQMNHGSSNAHVQWFSHWKMEQTIMTSLCDVMRISCAKKGGSYKKRAWLNLRAVVTVILVFQYKAFGLVCKPQTLYLGYRSALWGGSITRMNFATYLSICMHPDLSGGFSVSTASVVGWQPGRSLPSPLEPGIKQSTDHNPLVANCKGRINS